MSELPSPEVCPVTNEYCPLLADCIRREDVARTRVEELDQRFMDHFANRDRMLRDLQEPTDQGQRMIEHPRTTRQYEKHQAALVQELEAAQQLVEINSEHADQIRETCSGGPLSAKRWGLFGKPVVRCAAPMGSNILFDPPEA